MTRVRLRKLVTHNSLEEALRDQNSKLRAMNAVLSKEVAFLRRLSESKSAHLIGYIEENTQLRKDIRKVENDNLHLKLQIEYLKSKIKEDDTKPYYVRFGKKWPKKR